MNIQHIWEFNSIVTLGNLSSAARALNISQSTLSKHLVSMEQELGVTLFDRTQGSQKIVLTPQGELFSQIGIKILDEWNQLKIGIKELSAVKHLRIASSTEALYASYVSRLKRKLQEDKAGFTIHWASPEKQTTFEMLRNNQVDIILEPLPAKNDALGFADDLYGLEQMVLFSDPAVVVAHKADKLNRYESVSIKDLKDQHFLLVLDNKIGPIANWTHGICNDRGFSPKLTSLSNYPSFITMLSDQLRPGYITLLPSKYAKSCIASIEEAAIVPIADPDAVFQMNMLWRKTDTALYEGFLATAESLSTQLFGF